MNAYTASQLINQTLPLRQYKTKKIDQIDSRQHILLNTSMEILSTSPFSFIKHKWAFKIKFSDRKIIFAINRKWEN